MIADQLRAFEAKDLDAAFAHASPGIKSRFSTPEKSGNMVAAGSVLRLLTWLPRPLSRISQIDADFAASRSMIVSPIQWISYGGAGIWQRTRRVNLNPALCGCNSTAR
ncbi:MAG: DUF4864 domain-containing protein [Proteobacteria bacterium]|nr:DUF4864 domain-containing protein [Pseudomonadota bacterium]